MSCTVGLLFNLMLQCTYRGLPYITAAGMTTEQYADHEDNAAVQR